MMIVPELGITTVIENTGLAVVSLVMKTMMVTVVATVSVTVTY